jgi:hypothetical protein
MRYVPALRSCDRGTRALNSIRESATIAHCELMKLPQSISTPNNCSSRAKNSSTSSDRPRFSGILFNSLPNLAYGFFAA